MFTRLPTAKNDILEIPSDNWSRRDSCVKAVKPSSHVTKISSFKDE